MRRRRFFFAEVILPLLVLVFAVVSVAILIYWLARVAAILFGS